MSTEIYSRYRTGSPSFGLTLRVMEDLISARLMPEFRRVWVQGSNSGKVNLIFTIFENGKSYRMEFETFKNFRNYKPEGELETEIRLMEELINRLRDGVLTWVIS